jgi:hypothetical protein
MIPNPISSAKSNIVVVAVVAVLCIALVVKLWWLLAGAFILWAGWRLYVALR